MQASTASSPAVSCSVPPMTMFVVVTLVTLVVVTVVLVTIVVVVVIVLSRLLIISVWYVCLETVLDLNDSS